MHPPPNPRRDRSSEDPLDAPTAALRIGALFPDRGAHLLSEAELQGTWEQVLGAVPGRFLQVPDDERAGEQLLVHVREHYSQAGNLRAAIAITRVLVRRRVAELGEDHPDALVEIGALGALADRAGKTAEAGQMLERAYAGLRSVAGGRDLRLAIVAGNLAWHYLRVEQPMKAEQFLEQAYRIRKDVAPETTGFVAAQVGELMVRRGRAEDAVPYLQEAWERYRDQYGVADTRTIARARTLAAILTSLDRETEAIPVLRVIFQAAVRDGDAEKRATVGFQLGKALEAVGQREESYRLVEDAVRWTREQRDHAQLGTRLAEYARMIYRRGRPVEAEGLMREALEADLRLYGDRSAEVALRYTNLGHLCMQLGRIDEAMGWLEPAAKLLRSTLGDGHWQTRYAVELLVELWVQTGKAAVEKRDHRYARAVFMEAEAMAIPVLGEKHRLVHEIRKHGLT